MASRARGRATSRRSARSPERGWRRGRCAPTPITSGATRIRRSALGALEFPFFALEEPLGTGDCEGMRRIALTLDTRIILDESLLRADQLERFCDSTDRWIANVRVSKMGGLLRSLELARERAGEART
ncbi:MAG: enolase C-terminal domain-like protein [Gammaproteobacteria bacterium]